MPHVDTPQSICRFGVARCDITPPVGIYHRMRGGGHPRSRHRRPSATDRHGARRSRPRPARRRGDASRWSSPWTIACSGPREMEQLTATVCRQTGVAAEQVAVCFPHARCRPARLPRRTDLPGGELIPRLPRRAGRARGRRSLSQAAGDPAGDTRLWHRPLSAGAHRDFWDEASRAVGLRLQPRRHRPTTPSWWPASRSSRQRSLATVVNYACHPTTLAWENTLISPDYVGAMREVIEQATGVPVCLPAGRVRRHRPARRLRRRTGRGGPQRPATRLRGPVRLEALPPPGTRFAYAGPVVSGADARGLGARAARRCGPASRRRLASAPLDGRLPVRPELPTSRSKPEPTCPWHTEERRPSKPAIDARPAIATRWSSAWIAGCARLEGAAAG